MRSPAPTPEPTAAIPARRPHGRSVALGLTAAAFVTTGALHFAKSDDFQRIVPAGLPSPKTLVVVSGLAEIAGGLGLLVPRLRRPAGWGLIALLVAVFPANVYMAVRPDRFTDLGLPAWGWWARLPLQPVLMAWVWWVSRVPAGPGQTTAACTSAVSQSR